MHKGTVWAYNCSSFSLPSRNLMPAEDLALKSAASSSLNFFRRFCDHSCVRHMHHQTRIRAPSIYPVNHPALQQSSKAPHVHCHQVLQPQRQEEAVGPLSFVTCCTWIPIQDIHHHLVSRRTFAGLTVPP